MIVDTKKTLLATLTGTYVISVLPVWVLPRRLDHVTSQLVAQHLPESLSIYVRRCIFGAIVKYLFFLYREPRRRWYSKRIDSLSLTPSHKMYKLPRFMPSRHIQIAKNSAP